MTAQKFEVYGSMKDGVDGTQAFLLSDTIVTVTYSEMLDAIALTRHKQLIDKDKCIGYKITDKEVLFMFKK